jgi:putative ABC transport system permease protein
MITKDIIFQLSVRSVRLHFLRSVLAALGIVIGVVAIAAMGMMGANMTLSVTEELSSMANVLVVQHSSGQGGGMMFPGGGGGWSSSDDDESYISRDEFQDIERTASKYGMVYPLYSKNGEQFEIGSAGGRATVYGLDDDIMRAVLTVEEGDYPTSTSTVIVGPSLAERYELEIGSRLKLGDEDDEDGGGQVTVRVVGILEERGMSSDMNTDNAIIVTDKWFEDYYDCEGEYNQVNIVLDDITDADAATEAIEDQLNRKEETVRIEDSSSRMETITETIGTLTTFVMAIAGISLLVAAVSIFNVMMMSVTERIREIGILRSIGTQKGEILRMFVYEATILGVVGAGIGAVLSVLIGYFVVFAMVGTTEYFFEPGSLVYVPMAMLIGIAICMFSGVYPAWRASNLDPIEALRAE